MSATLATLRERVAKIQKRDPDAWTRAPIATRREVWAAHVATYGHRIAIERAARKHGRMLGPYFCELLAARLVCVDEGPDGSRLTEEAAAAIVETCAREGKALTAA